MFARLIEKRTSGTTRRILGGSAAIWLAVACSTAWGQDAAGKGDAGATQRTGQLIRLTLPLDARTVEQAIQTVRRTLDQAGGTRPVFIFEFDVPPGAADGGRGTKYGLAYDLADFLVSDALNAANTVAYIPKPVKGNAVLVALACEQIIMAENATLGEAGIDEKAINPALLTAYRTIANSRHTVPEEVAVALLDKSVELWRVRVAGDKTSSVKYVTPAELEKLRRQNMVIMSQDRLKAPGQPWNFTGAEARGWDFVRRLANDRLDVVKALDLPPETVTSDPSRGRPWKAIRVNLRGVIKHDDVNEVQRMISDEMRSGANFVCLWIDSPGGSPTDSVALANFLADLNSNEVRTVAYIENEALADAAIIAMACDQVVMLPGATLGGAGAYPWKPEDIPTTRQTIRDSIARNKLRSWSLWAAIVDAKLDVYRCTRLDDTQYFSDEELQERQPERGPKWEKQELATVPGRLLKVSGEKAVEYHMANFTVDSFAQFKERYGLENDPALVEPGWADFLMNVLRRQEVAILLLFIGGAALYFELHTPGLGIGGFVATVCFALFFWSRFLNGTAGWLQVVLFVTGIIFILLEVFVLPGFGIFGLGGGALVLASLVLASQTFFIPKNEYQLVQMQRSLLTVAAAVGGLIVAAVALRRFLPRSPMLGHVFLAPPEGAEAETISRREMLVDLDSLVGQSGVAATPLVPGGKARFGNHLIDVMADGEFVARDRPVVVTEVHGNRVVVRPAE